MTAKVVVYGVVVVQHAQQVAAKRAVGALIFDRHAVHQVAMQGVVVGYQRGRVWPGEAAQGFVQGAGQDLGVELLQRLAIIVTPGCWLTRGDVWAVDNSITSLLARPERLFDD